MKNILIKKEGTYGIYIGYIFILTYSLIVLFSSSEIYPSLMSTIYMHIWGNAVFSENGEFGSIAILIITSLALIVLLISLFIRQCKFKNIANIVLQIVCMVDIGFCVYYMANNYKTHSIMFSVIESVIDAVFIILILLRIFSTHKKINKQNA